MEMIAFCYIWGHNFWTNYNLDLLRTSKWPSEPQFCERWRYIWQNIGQKRSHKSYLRVTFISKHSLVCIKICAILSFQTSGSNVRANVILISQGQIGSLSNEDALKVQEMSKKHQFRLYNMPLVHKMNNMSLHFETLSHSTGGNTFIIQPNKPNRLDVYMDILDALREIRRRSESNGPSLVRYYSQCMLYYGLYGL